MLGVCGGEKEGGERKGGEVLAGREDKRIETNSNCSIWRKEGRERAAKSVLGESSERHE